MLKFYFNRKQYEEVGNEKVEKKIEGERVFRGQKYKVAKVDKTRDVGWGV